MLSRFLCLAYHSISPEYSDALSVHPDKFRKQMQFLKSSGYRVVPLEQALLCQERNRNEKIAIITFDDGYEDNFRYAFPILHELGFPSTIFLIVSLVGTGTTLKWANSPFSRSILSWSQVEEMQSSGLVSFGSHTMTHRMLTDLSLSEAKWEIETSRRVLEEQLNTQVHSFCYPAGRFNPSIADLVKHAGYKVAVYTPSSSRTSSLHQEGFHIARIGIYQHDSLLSFRLKRSTAFVYLRKWDAYWKLVRHLRSTRP